MTGFLIVLHVLACTCLIIIILVQAGRGGGLVEGFSKVESMFGPKTSSFLTKATTIFSIIFFITCLSLAILSSRQSRSLMRNVQSEPVSASSIPETAKPASEAAAASTAVKTAPETKNQQSTTKPESAKTK